MNNKEIFEEVIMFDLPKITNFPQWRTFQELDEPDGVHAEDIINIRLNAIKHLSENNYSVALFKRNKQARCHHDFYVELELLITQMKSQKLREPILCFIFPAVWNVLNELNIDPTFICTIDWNGPITWSDKENLYQCQITYPFSETETQTFYKTNKFSPRNKDQFCLLLFKK